jgi:hypothetical protein
VEVTGDFCKQLQNVWRLGYMNAGIGNTKIMKIIGTNGKSTINNNRKKLTDFCVFNNIRIMTFLKA